MPKSNLTQAEANLLLEMEKHRVNDNLHVFPTLGGRVEIPIVSANNRENFILDISRSRINLKKTTCQHRVQTVVILARLDIEGAPHMNPDGEEILCPHLHLYREGYGDKWAVPAPQNAFPRTSELWGSLEDFMAYCRITQKPIIEKELFI